MTSGPSPSPYDEAYDERGEPRPHYAELLASLGDPGGLKDELRRRLGARGVTFGDDPAVLDPVPRVITEPEWSELEAGIDQRLRALDALVADVYGGDGRVFEAGVLDRAEVESSPHWEPLMRGASPRRWIAFVGLDVIRCEDGRFRVIEDQLRMPSGIAYAVAARETTRGLLAVEPPSATSRPSSGSWRSPCGTRPRPAWTSLGR